MVPSDIIMNSDSWLDEPEDPDEAVYAQGRLPERTYVSKSFDLKRRGSVDDGAPARFICKVFDPEAETIVQQEFEEWVIRETPAGRYQFKLLIARDPGHVKQMWIQRVPSPGHVGSVKDLLNLQQPEVGQLIDFLKSLDSIPIEGNTTLRLDDDLIRDIFEHPETLATLYKQGTELIRNIISNDETARDVVAVAARRTAVEEFRKMLANDEYFDSRVDDEGIGTRERVWQDFLEKNPWILGVTLSSQLLTSWSDERLEQIVTGADLQGVGKRTDAMMRTAGQVRSMVFAEIKTHKTKLLSTEYRSGCWSVSADLSGGVAQLQGTVHRAVESIGLKLQSRDSDGSEVTGDVTYLVQPRSVLVVGQLGELKGAGGGDHADKIRSFELYRRSLMMPEIITFDELLARAEWVVEAVATEDIKQETAALEVAPE